MIPLSRPMIGLEERLAVDAVLRSGTLAKGPAVTDFETAFADYVGVRHAVAVSSGTTALHVGFAAAGVGSGDQVIVPSFTFAGTANAVCLTGATPVFADVDRDSLCVDAATIAPLLGGKVKAVVAVHLYGRPAPLDELAELCTDHDVLLVEDAAQAPGARWRDRTVGSVGAFGAFSFYATKNITTGEGGMLTTNDKHLAEAARMLRDQGMGEQYRHDVVGLNGRMTAMAAALGLAQLPKLDEWNASAGRQCRRVRREAGSTARPAAALGRRRARLPPVHDPPAGPGADR